VGELWVSFTAAAVANAGTTLGAIVITGGATYAQIAGLTLNVVSAINASGVSVIPPGTGVIFSAANAATLTSNSLAAGGAAAATIYAVYDITNSVNHTVTGGSLGFQQTNSSGQPLTAGGYSQSINPINVYSFSLAPEEHQPSGSCNFSRVDTTTLVFDSITGADGQALAAGRFPSKNFPYLFRLYAVNYNIFRVMSGMGGLAYSN
jgi:hypothetical protein